MFMRYVRMYVCVCTYVRIYHVRMYVLTGRWFLVCKLFTVLAVQVHWCTIIGLSC